MVRIRSRRNSKGKFELADQIKIHSSYYEKIVDRDRYFDHEDHWILNKITRLDPLYLNSLTIKELKEVNMMIKKIKL